jgi:hypothetical protein
MGRHYTKTDVVVEVADVVVVAVGATGVPVIIVEGTAPSVCPVTMKVIWILYPRIL